MHVKIQGGGQNVGIHANAGSCAAMVEYLQHEDNERKAEGKEVFEFYTGQGMKVSPGEVIQKIDRNHRKLCAADAKFFHLSINLSKDEIPYLGSTETEIVASGTVLCEKLTDIYAKNFNHAGISGGKDIMVFFKPHFTRGDKGDREFHIHGIVSRKDIHNKYKLSPMSNHRNTTEGRVKGGFDRKAFALKVESAFDELFLYPRKVSDTFTYKLAMKQGTVEEKVEQEAKLSKEEAKEITAKEAEQVMPDITRTIHDALARRDARRRNAFWNIYHSRYKPQYDSLKAACDRSLLLHKVAKERYSVNSQVINDRYSRLRLVYDEMNRRNADVQRAKTAKGTWRAIAALIFAMNPVAGILVGLVSSIITEANVSAAIQARQAIRAEAQGIKTDIETLKAEQAELRNAKSTMLKNHIENKMAKQELQDEITALKAELDKPLQQESAVQPEPTVQKEPEARKPSLAEFVKHYDEYKAGKAPSAQEQKSQSLSNSVYAFARKDEVLAIFRTSATLEALHRELASRGITFQEVTSHKGVTDMTIIASGEKSFTVNASKFGPDYLRQLLEEYKKVTKRGLATKPEQEIVWAKDIRMAMPISGQIGTRSIKRKQQAQKPENKPATPHRTQAKTPGCGDRGI